MSQMKSLSDADQNGYLVKRDTWCQIADVDPMLRYYHQVHLTLPSLGMGWSDYFTVFFVIIDHAIRHFTHDIIPIVRGTAMKVKNRE